MGKSLNDIKRDIALLTLDIECLDPDSKHSAIAYLEKTIDLLKLGAEHDLASLANQDLSEEKQQTKMDDETSKDKNAWMFNDDTFIDDIDYESNNNLEESVPVQENKHPENESNIDQGEKMEISTQQVPNNEIKQEPVNQEPVVISLNPNTFHGQIDSENDMFKCDPCDVYLPKSFTLQHEQDPRHQAKVSTDSALQTNPKMVETIDESAMLDKETELATGTERTTALNKQTFQHDKDSKMLQCPECPNQYNKRKSFMRHQIMHTGKYKCQRCEAGFTERSRLELHSRNPESCLKLQKIRKLETNFVSVKAKMQAAMPISNEKTEAKMHICNLCNKQYKNRVELLQHNNMHTGKFNCSRCNAPFRRRRELEKHSRKAVNCIKLKKIRTSTTAPVNSDKSNVPEPEFEKQNLASPSNSQRETVLPTSTSVESKGLLLQCPECSKFYSNEHSLKNHMPIHTDKYKCPKCESRFTSTSTLAAHNCETTLKKRSKAQQVSTGIAVAECQDCGMRFVRQESLKSHKYEHTGMFKCASCSVSFRGSCELAKHSRNKDKCKSTLSKRKAMIRRSRLLYSAPVHNPPT